MTDKPKALMLCPEPPYPAVGGGPLRTASLIEYLARKYVLDVVVFRESGSSAAAIPNGLARRAAWIDVPYHARGTAPRTWRAARRLIQGCPPLVDRFAGFGARVEAALADERYDLGVVEHFWCAPYADLLRRYCTRLVLDLHNIESAWHESCAHAARWTAWAYRRFAQAARGYERAWLPRYDLLLTASEADAQRVRDFAPVAVYPNAIPYASKVECVGENCVAFSGNFAYSPNASAVRFFRREVWPLIREQRPGLRWRLIGKNPQAVRGEIAGDPRIEAAGPVENAVLELARARVVVAPLLAGSGTRVKILEAWAASRAVVSTPLGAEGLDARDGIEILLARDAPEFAQAVLRLLGDDTLRLHLGEAGRTLYERRYTWQAAWEALGRQSTIL